MHTIFPINSTLIPKTVVANSILEITAGNTEFRAAQSDKQVHEIEKRILNLGILIFFFTKMILAFTFT